MFKHCINQFEERVIYNLIDTPHKLQFVCCAIGFILNLFMHLCYNNLNDILTSWITPPWFGIFYIGKTPIWVYCLIVIIGFVIGCSVGYWWGIVQNDYSKNGRKRWCLTQADNYKNQVEKINYEQKEE